MRWFGNPEGDRSQCQRDSGWVPTPVGAQCPFCPELIAEGDYGEVLDATEVLASGRKRPITVYVHAGCMP